MQKLQRAMMRNFRRAALFIWPILLSIPIKPAAADDTVQIASVRYLGSQFLDNTVGVTGADGATSVVLSGGNALWVFGDTVLGKFDSIRGLELTGLPTNTAALVPPQDVAQGIKRFEFLTNDDRSRPRQIVPFADDEDPARHRVWAVHGICLDSTVYLYYHRITLLKGVDVFLNFQLDGMGIARSDVGELRFNRLAAPDGTREFWKGDQPGFGVFVDRQEDYLYLWGCLMTQMFLARVEPEHLEDLASYEYLVEAPTSTNPAAEVRWAKTFQPTAPLFDSVPNEMSAAYNAYLGRYVAFHTYHRDNQIVLRTAPGITGPWSDHRVVYRPEKKSDGEFIYAAKEHPELAREGGRIMYVTFVNSGTYIPQLIEITLR